MNPLFVASLKYSFLVLVMYLFPKKIQNINKIKNFCLIVNFNGFLFNTEYFAIIFFFLITSNIQFAKRVNFNQVY